MHAEDVSEPGRDGEAVFGQRNGMQIDVDNSAQVCATRPTADHDPPLDAPAADANRNLSIRLDGKNPGQMRDLLNDVLGTSLDKAHRGVMPVGDKIGNVDQRSEER